MKNLNITFTAAGLIILMLSGGSYGCKETNVFEKEGYTQLFNGEDLTGWIIPEGDNAHWKVLDGVIDYDALSEAEGDKNLWTEKEYGDFMLHIEWRFKEYSGLYPMPTILPGGDYKVDENGETITEMKKNSDSGILLKGAGQANLWCWDVGSGELWQVRNNLDLAPEIRSAAVPLVKADNPVGEWNTMDITLTGETLTIVLNDKTVIDNARHPGMPESGRVGLQHHGGLDKETGKMYGSSSLIQFRNIWIKEI